MNKRTVPSSQKKYKIIGILLLAYGIFSFIFVALPAFRVAQSTGIVTTITCLACIIGALILLRKSRTIPYNEESAQPYEHSPDPSMNPTPTPEKRSPDLAPQQTIAKRFHVAGTTFHLEDILSLSYENPTFDLTKKELVDEELTGERIYQYEFAIKKVELVEEPDNPVDKNAVKVIADGKHIGYIKKGSCAQIKKLLSSGTICGMDCEIYGGHYKVLIEDQGDEYLTSEKRTYSLECDESPFSAVVTIYLKNPK